MARKTRKKSYRDLVEQADRISELAKQAGAEKSDGTVSVDGIDQPFSEINGNVEAARRANAALTEIEKRKQNIYNGRMFNRYEENASNRYYIDNDYEKYLESSDRGFTRKYSEDYQKNRRHQSRGLGGSK